MADASLRILRLEGEGGGDIYRFIFLRDRPCIIVLSSYWIIDVGINIIISDVVNKIMIIYPMLLT